MHRLSFSVLLLTLCGLLLPSQGQAGKPEFNILFAIADDWGCHAGAYGTPWVKTPAVDRVAREGLLFKQAYTPKAKCAPSRACILTGRNPWQLKEAANHLCFFPPEFRSWMEVLAENGWTTGHTVKGWGPGVAKDVNGKLRELTGPAFNGKTAPSLTSGIGKADYAANFSTFLKQADGKPQQPWCFWFGCIEPHRDYEYGSGVAKGGKQLTDIPAVPGYWPDNDTTRNDMLDYSLEVEHFDSHLGRMLAELEKRGELERTLVIVTSDHGWPFPRCKGNVYEDANHVPLAVRFPRGIRQPGRKVDEFVSFVDIAPTILDYAGLGGGEKPVSFQPVAGQSWRQIFEETSAVPKKSGRDFVLLGKERTDIGRPQDAGFPTRGIRKGTWLYVKNYATDRWPAGNPETGYLDCDAGATKTFLLEKHRTNAADPFWKLCFGKRPAEELYDLAADPHAVKNLADSSVAEHVQAKKELAAAMEKQLIVEEDPRVLGKGEVFDAYPHANKGNQGYYEKFMAGKADKAQWVSPTDYETINP